MRAPARRPLLIGALVALLTTPAPQAQERAQDPDPPAPSERGPVPAQPDPAEGQILKMMVEAAGGQAAWDALEGVRYDMLLSVRNPATAQKGGWKVTTRTPTLCHFDNQGSGYLKEEHVNVTLDGATYRRVILANEVGWSEMGERYFRDRGMGSAFAAVRREFFLGAFPFSLASLGAQAHWVGERQHEGGIVWVYRLELKKPVIMMHTERLREFHMFVNPETKRIERLRFTFKAGDRLVPRLATNLCQVDFLGEVALGEVILPHKRVLWYENPFRIWELWIEKPLDQPLSPAAVRKPWVTGSTWQDPDRADSWDPPRPDAPAPAGDADGSRSEPPGGGG